MMSDNDKKPRVLRTACFQISRQKILIFAEAVKVRKIKYDFKITGGEQGLSRLVKGARLRVWFRRDTWVQIPSPAYLSLIRSGLNGL